VTFEWISLTTDYGLADGFAAACHGVIARLAPAVRVIDITHLVEPGDIAGGATVLAQHAPHLPPSVHVAVVDPGVGTSRRAVAIEAANGVLVGPDNGLLPPAAQALGGAVRAVALTNTRWFAGTVSPTFHGRDIFAPVAARLARGEPLADAGPPVALADLVRLPPPAVEIGEDYVEAEVVAIDRFGNLQLSAPASALSGLAPRLIAGGVPATRGHTFGDVPIGGLVVFADSAGRVAIAVNAGRACDVLAVGRGDTVRLTVRQ
jgi:S-adenosylmethionine hydrolase